MTCKRGVAGVVTDGGFRDTATIGELDIPAYHTRPSTRLWISTYRSVVATFPSSPVISSAAATTTSSSSRRIAQEVADEAVEMTGYEDVVIERVKEGAAIIGLYPCTEEARTAIRKMACDQRAPRQTAFVISRKMLKLRTIAAAHIILSFGSQHASSSSPRASITDTLIARGNKAGHCQL